MVFAIIIIFVMAVASFEDIRKKEIPLFVILACFLVSAVSVITGICMGKADICGILISFVPGVFLLLLSFVSRGGIGTGDGLIILAAGPAIGIYTTGLGLIVAFFASSVVSAALLIIRRANRKTRIPFVPFMTFGMGVMMLAQL